MNDAENREQHKIHIALLDSGVSTSFLKQYSLSIKGVTVMAGQIVPGEFEDVFGHGTAVYSLLSGLTQNCDITAIKLYDTPDNLTGSAIEDALEYVEKNLSCDIVHLSLGTTDPPSDRMDRICRSLQKRNTIVIAAFDNVGAMSYPAALSSVIGVQESNTFTRANEFAYIESDEINISARGGITRIRWTDPRGIFVQGASFSAVYITSIIATLMHDGIRGTERVLQSLRYKAAKIVDSPKRSHPIQTMFHVDKAVAFPFGKEIENLALNYDMLPFDLIGIYDVKISGRVGVQIKGHSPNISRYTIEDYCSLWQAPSFDTLILGYTDHLVQHLPHLRKSLLEKCLEYHINVYFLEDLPEDAKIKAKLLEAGLKVFTPVVTIEDVPSNRFGRLFRIQKPIVAVLGTGSNQGKFSLQLALWRILRRNYHVALVGTEPTSPLFGMDYCYPMGYHGSIPQDGYASVSILNDALHRMEKTADIILAAGQYGTVPFDFANVSMHTGLQYDFLVGIRPELVLLTVNPYDSIDYIQRTISYIESSVEAVVAALIPFPITLEQATPGGIYRKRLLTSVEYQRISEVLVSKFHKPVINPSNVEGIISIIIDYFAEE